MKLHLVVSSLVIGGFTLGTAALAQQPPVRNDPAKPVELALEDQFEQKQSLADHRGKVVILVFGDRKGIDASRELGEKLHVMFHPTAAGQQAAKARLAAVVALTGVPEGKPSPDVAVMPVACAGNVPGPVKSLIRASLRRDAADVPVWLDFSNIMADRFGMRDAEPNVAVFDAQGRLRLKVNGTPDKATYDKLLQTIQNLRAEAAGLR